MITPVVGQRWINEAELSLGLGTLVGFDERTLRIDFGALGEIRTYAYQSAALSRVQFEIGDKLRSKDGLEVSIASFSEEGGLITYSGKDADGNPVDLHEIELSDFTQINRPNQRLFAGQIDKPQYYRLRQSARRLNDVIAHSQTRGLINGRTSLIPHQLYIANEVAHRQSPRVLLADEVGLGKTIEAGLILNARLINGTAQRVLIVVPEHLINQWLVEMLRRFNLRFSLFDQARIEEAFVQGDEFPEELTGETEIEHENPFESEQLVLCSLSLFEDEKAREQVKGAGWDMLVVDEAHHLEWAPDNASEDYLLIEQLASKIDSVLLLTATPEQLGKQGHFARLRLLDPARFYDFDTYIKEESGYISTAEVIELLESNIGDLPDKQWLEIESALSEPDLVSQLAKVRSEKGAPRKVELRDSLVTDLLDRHGTGRLLFRNTRAAIQGFPVRKLFPYPLELPDQYSDLLAQDWRQQLTPEMLWSESTEALEAEESPEAQEPAETKVPWSDFDPRVAWLLDFLKQASGQKTLVITANAETALDLVEVLRVRTGIAAAVFHESMSILERDRAAAFFADEDYGAPCLICSEIGSEGRNFQFAHRMVLFDLPSNPDLLEQRIGRLDRIGQTETIQIHVPYMSGVHGDLFHFYHEALDAFEHTSAVALQVMQLLGQSFEQEMSSGDLSEKTLEKAKELRLKLEEELQSGRDRLLERNSCRVKEAQQLIKLAEQDDSNQLIQGFIQLFCDNSGIAYEEQTNGFFIMRPTESMTLPLNGLPDEGLTLTYNRSQALSNEDIDFFTWDHPVVVSALDSVLAGETGNTTLVTMKVGGVRPGTLLLEAVFVLECPGNRFLQSSRFLPSTRLRVLMDHKGNELDKITEQLIDQNQQLVKRSISSQIAKSKRDELQPLIEKASQIANKSSESMRVQAIAQAREYFKHEIDRLESLQKVNPSIREDEIHSLKETESRLLDSLEQTELNLDALRLVIFT